MYFWTYTSKNDEDDECESCSKGCCSSKKDSKKDCKCSGSCGDACKCNKPIKNNDGRDTCYVCGNDTYIAGGGQYRLCKNKSCKWYNN